MSRPENIIEHDSRLLRNGAIAAGIGAAVLAKISSEELFYAASGITFLLSGAFEYIRRQHMDQNQSAEATVSSE